MPSISWLTAASSQPGGTYEAHPLIEKRISDIELVGIDILAGENRKEPYLSRNPAGQTPLLELDDGTALAETGAICEYLEELYPDNPLIGASANERATTRMWWRRVEIGICHPMVFGFYYAEAYDLFKERVYCIPQAAEGLKQRARVAMRWLDRQLSPGTSSPVPASQSRTSASTRTRINSGRSVSPFPRSARPCTRGSTLLTHERAPRGASGPSRSWACAADG